MEEGSMKKILFLTVAFCLVAATAFGANTIKIGLMAPLTGPWASEGQDMKRQIRLPERVMKFLLGSQDLLGAWVGLVERF